MIIYINVSGSVFHAVSDEWGTLAVKKNFKTFCNIIIDVTRATSFTTLSSYDSVHTICTKCINNISKSIFMSSLNNEPRYMRNQNNSFNSILSLNREYVSGPSIKYKKFLTKRKYPFLSKLKRNARNTK